MSNESSERAAIQLRENLDILSSVMLYLNMDTLLSHGSIYAKYPFNVVFKNKKSIYVKK